MTEFRLRDQKFPEGSGCPYARVHALLRRHRGDPKESFCAAKTNRSWGIKDCDNAAVAWGMIDDHPSVTRCRCHRKRFSYDLMAYEPQCHPHNKAGWAASDDIRSLNRLPARCSGR